MIKQFALNKASVRIGHTQDGLIRLVVNSKEIGNYLTQTFGTFRTLSYDNGLMTKARLPVQLLRDSGYLPEFLQAAFSCEAVFVYIQPDAAAAKVELDGLLERFFLHAHILHCEKITYLC